MISKILADLEVLINKKPNLLDFCRNLLFKKEFHMVLVYRLSYMFYRYKLGFMASIFQRINIVLFGVDISYKIDIGKGFKINHGIGLVIGNANIGERVSVYHNVTIGTNYPELTKSNKPKGYPTIEDRVIIFPGSVVVGPINIGKGTIINSNSVVTKDIASLEETLHMDKSLNGEKIL